jgi:putative acetyltransferase
MARRTRSSPSPSSRAEPDLARDVQRVRETSRRMVRELGLLRGECHGLSTSQCHALLELSQRGALSGSDVANLLALDKSTASRVLSPLVRRRLVRAKLGDGDKRSRAYELSANGSVYLQKVNAGADAQVQAALALLSDDDRAAAVRGLMLYAGALRRARLLVDVEVRPIARTDNAAVARVIRTVMPEFGASGPGFAIMDPEVDDMFGAYRKAAAYLVAVRNGRLLGGAGVGPLPKAPASVCELKKMYLLPEARGLGVGQALLDAALAAASRLRYRRCYLETLSHMHQARRLYEKNGFVRRDGPLGHTGHFGCNTFYERGL